MRRLKKRIPHHLVKPNHPFLRVRPNLAFSSTFYTWNIANRH